jgi:hypothetical protein
MFVNMTKKPPATTFEPLGVVLRRVAGKLAAQSNLKKKAGLPESAGESAGCPAGINTPDGGKIGGALTGENRSAPGTIITGEEPVRGTPRFQQVRGPRRDTVGPLIASLQGGPTGLHFFASKAARTFA